VGNEKGEKECFYRINVPSWQGIFGIIRPCRRRRSRHFLQKRDGIGIEAFAKIDKITVPGG